MACSLQASLKISYLEVRFTLEMHSVFIEWKYSYPAVSIDNRYTRDFLFQVLSYCGRLPSRIQRMFWIESDIIVTNGKRFLVLFCSPYHYGGPAISLTYYSIHHLAYGLWGFPAKRRDLSCWLSALNTFSLLFKRVVLELNLYLYPKTRYRVPSI